MNPVYSLLQPLLAQADRPVFFGGAGCSTDSGIPDFRSQDGLYRARPRYGVPYETMLSLSYFYAHPKEFYAFYWDFLYHPLAKPNRVHLALAEYGKTHSLTTVTQNIDGLDLASGQRNVLEIHGSLSRFTCKRCHSLFPSSGFEPGSIPICPHCHEILKPDIVFYEEALPEEVFAKAIEAFEKADILVVGGTSLRVYPAASLPTFFHGKTSILINKESTPLDEEFDYVLHEDLGEALSQILGKEK